MPALAGFLPCPPTAFPAIVKDKFLSIRQFHINVVRFGKLLPPTLNQSCRLQLRQCAFCSGTALFEHLVFRIPYDSQCLKASGMIYFQRKCKWKAEMKNGGLDFSHPPVYNQSMKGIQMQDLMPSVNLIIYVR